MNEARGYIQAVNTYFAANGRLPGDPDNTGTMGANSSSYFTKEDYLIGYVHGNEHRLAPWVDLNRETIINYDYKNEISFTGKESKYIKKAVYQFIYNYTIDDCYSPINDYRKDFLYKNVMALAARYDGYIPSRIAANIEEKMDDKSLNTGNVRIGLCSNTIPENEALSDDIILKAEYNYDFDIVSYENLVSSNNGACKEIDFELDI